MEGFLAVESDWSISAPVLYLAGDGQNQIEGSLTVHEPRRCLETTVSLRYTPELREEPASRLRWQIQQPEELCKLTVIHDDLDLAVKSAADVAICMPSILSNLRILLETGRPD